MLRPRKKPLKIYKIAASNKYMNKRAYDPSDFIDSTRNSSLWSWRRVKAWEKYINDPLENKRGHKIMI